MKVSHRMKQLFDKNSKEVGFEEFKNEFYRKLRVYSIGFVNGAFDSFLKVLYESDENTYNEFLESTKNIPYGFIKNNMDLVINLIKNKRVQDIEVACQMLEYQTTLISRNVHSIHVTSVLNEKKKMLLNIEKCLLLMKSENEDNILRKAQRDFYDRFKDCETNPYLSDLYNKILDEFEDKMINAFEMNRNRIEGISERYTHTRLDAHVIDTIEVNKRDRYSFRNRVH